VKTALLHLKCLIETSLFSLFIAFFSPTHSYASPENTPRTIIISCDDWVDYCNKDGSGWYMDMLREIYGAENINIKLKSEPFARGLESVKTGKADAILTGYNIPERQQVYTLSKIRIDNEQTVIVFNPTTPYDKQKPLSGKVGFVRGVAYQEFFNDQVDPVEVTHRNQGIEMLTHKRIDYFMAEFTETLQAISELKMKPTDFVFERIAVKPLYVMFQKNEAGQALADIYDRGIVTLYQEGQPQALAQKHHIPDFSVYFPEIEDLPQSAKTHKLPK
jgi:ABC-type amino acid transport substrate-binding protein